MTKKNNHSFKHKDKSTHHIEDESDLQAEESLEETLLFDKEEFNQVTDKIDVLEEDKSDTQEEEETLGSRFDVHPHMTFSERIGEFIAKFKISNYTSTHDEDEEEMLEDDLLATDEDSVANESPSDESLTSDKMTHYLEETQEFHEPIITDQSMDEVLQKEELLAEEELEKELEEELDEHAIEEKQSSFTSGAAWLTVGTIISRILGAVYVIPWATWLGAEYMTANTLYSVGYKPYSLFLAISTAGFPSAIAKQMAYYHSKKEYNVADKLFKYSSLVMVLTGLLSGGLLFVMSPTLAYQSPTNNPQAAILVMRSLVPALIILPLMSLIRGYFQGFNDMKPTAISQILEQFARVAYMLAGTYAVMMVYHGEVTQAVVHSTFAAFVGAMVSFIYLVIEYFRRLPEVNRLKAKSLNRISLNFAASLKILIQDSIPFILLGSGIIIAQIIDTYSFSQILERTTPMLLTEISELYGAFSLDVDKLIMIVISLAVSLASSAVPSVTSLYATNDIKGTSKLVSHIMIVFSFIMLPAAFGMASIAENLYTLFYPMGHPQGPGLLVTASFSSIVLGIYTVLSTILQSMNFRRRAIQYLFLGIVVKLIIQVPFVAWFKAHGALLSTMIGFLVSSILMWIKIERELEIDHRPLLNDLIRIIFTATLMGLTTNIWDNLLNMAIGPVGRAMTFVKIMIVVVTGSLLYLGLMGLQGRLGILLGNRFKKLQDTLRMFE